MPRKKRSVDHGLNAQQARTEPLSSEREICVPSTECCHWNGPACDWVKRVAKHLRMFHSLALSLGKRGSGEITVTDSALLALGMAAHTATEILRYVGAMRGDVIAQLPEYRFPHEWHDPLVAVLALAQAVADPKDQTRGNRTLPTELVDRAKHLATSLEEAQAYFEWPDGKGSATLVPVSLPFKTTRIDLPSASDPNAPTHDGDERDEPAADAPDPLTKNERAVLCAMALFDAAALVSNEEIIEAMDATTRLASRTVGPIVTRFIERGIAERPAGSRSGSRLLPHGRRLAMKFAN